MRDNAWYDRPVDKRETVARAIWSANEGGRWANVWEDVEPVIQEKYRKMADAALSTIEQIDKANKAVAVRNGDVVESTKRGTRLADDWFPSEPVRRELSERFPNVLLGDILAEFRDYWCAIPGQRGTKLSWDRTFRNRVREVAHLPRYQRRRGLSTVDQKVADLQAMKEPE